MIKTNIKMKVTPKQSKDIQYICFANNLGKETELKLDFIDLDAPYLFINKYEISYTHNTVFYNKQKEEEVDADLFIRTNGTCEEDKQGEFEYVTLSSQQCKSECQFAKHGFEKPNFECKILGEIDGVLYGATWSKIHSTPGMAEFNWYPEQWDKVDGSAHDDSKYDLTPIKKPWYETCKFPCLVKDTDNNLVVIRTIEEYSAPYDMEYLKTLTPLTNDEIEGLKQ